MCVGSSYGAEISPQSISNMTDKVTPLVEEWRNRPLQSVYAIVYINGILIKFVLSNKMLQLQKTFLTQR